MSKPNKRSKICGICRETFTPKDFRANYCSIACRQSAREAKMQERYGVKNPAQLPKSPAKKSEISAKISKNSKWKTDKQAVLSKRNSNNLEKYGTTNTFDLPFNKTSGLNEEPWNKGKTGVYSDETRKAMGAANVGRTKTPEETAKRKASLKAYYADKPGPNKGKKMSDEQKAKISKSLSEKKHQRAKYNNQVLLELCAKSKVEFVSAESSVVGAHDFINIKCKNIVNEEECGREYEAKPNNLENSVRRVCPVCSLKFSRPETEIYEFVRSLYSGEILRNRRPKFMNRLELDIYLPNLNLAIELHGLAFHSERAVFQRGSNDPEELSRHLHRIKYLHRDKYLLCKKAGIKLIQIYEDEWRDKRDIVESMLKSRLGISERKIAARKTEVKELSPSESAEFFRKNHISGDKGGMAWFGLYSSGELVSAISLSSPSKTKKYLGYCEINRFASVLNTQVVGGFGKLLKYAKNWLGENRPEVVGIFTYADRRYGSGEVYGACGFKRLAGTKPDYCYERGGYRVSRWLKQKCKSLNGLTEQAQQANLGWYRLWGPGSEVYKIKI